MKHLNDYLDFFSLLKEQQTKEKIYNRPKDPFEYKVVDNNWLSRRKGKEKWYNITGVDFKPDYQKSIDLLDKEFPNARTKDAPKKGGQAAPKEVEYTRDNGQTATGTIVSVDKEKETVTIKGSESGKEFVKPFDKVEMASDELKKIADAPPPAEQKKEDIKSNQGDDQQRMLQSTNSKNPRPKGSKDSEGNREPLLGFFEADAKAVEYLKSKNVPIPDNTRTYVYPYPPENKDFNKLIILTGYRDDEDKIINLILKSEEGTQSFDKVDDAVDIANDVIQKYYPKAIRGREKKENQNDTALLLKTLGDKPPARLKGFFLADEKTKDFIKQKSTIADEGLTYVYPSPQNLKNGYVYFSGYNTQIKTIWVGTQKEEDSFEGESELQDAFNSAIELKEAYDRDFFTKDEVEGKKKVFTPTKTGEVDAEARAKSKARDQAEDNMR